MLQADITSTTQHNLVIYEMPLNDAVRICLRLENLFHQFEKTVNDPSPLATRTAMNALLKVLEVTDRPDIKSKLSQTLTQYANAFRQLNRSPQVNAQRLQIALKKVEELNHYLHTHNARIGESLRQNDFLWQIRSNLANPGGVCDYRLPAYMLWQSKPHTEKAKDLLEWMTTFQPLHDIAETILQLTRESTQLQTVTAENGFYLQPLNPITPCHLVRVAIAPQANSVYPEFGAGKHRLTIRFLEPSYFGSGKPTQTQKVISFQLACCKI
ncbi:MAG: cell division protein ZapD [Gammaproteobacteria bacterium CG_4_10_14_0_8_um_filter_38_16]|nr:MAG: cell division protein ZapD [Gammaproteobacteria bacterium CG_4_10_14_0_8_um_filter_38_16]PJA03783.1 MAG: cell division protein ZapD [Gammaproteobacteria bacterium CG_4_10_14_0_2_um_filter_38_22]PJB10394.1 MAG: cell division protein ZapD [Gammaproteobacteria bacterium CG_4_9_14_3_um_filter_38_9]